jgi:hypothetical protein
VEKTRALAIFCLTAAALSLIPSFSAAQLVLGQYQDEAPFRTWNTYPYSGAAALGRGETVFALADDSSAALGNPALLPSLPKFTLTVNSFYQMASFYKYGPVNTGVFASDRNIGQGILGLDFAGLSFRLKGWTFALNVSMIELYNRPEALVEYSPGGTLVYSLSFHQEGVLRNLNFSVARRINSWLSVGLGLNYVMGNLQRELVEQETWPDYTITDNKTQDFSGFYVNGGVYLEISSKLRVGAIFRTTYKKKSESNSDLNYFAPAGNTDISIPGSSKDTVDEPLVLGLGASWIVLPKLTFALDVAYSAWSKYSLDFFGEGQERNFKDTFKIGTGAEYKTNFELFGRTAAVPFRLGFIYDPQPMKEPRSSYLYLTFGNGLHWRRLHIDLGAMIGLESGSGDGLMGLKFNLSLGYYL